MISLIILLCAPIVHSDEFVKCYYCSSNPNEDVYDPDCATDGYDGHQGELALTYSCFTDNYGNGFVERGFDEGIHDNGECEYVPGSGNTPKWRCHCDTDLCNNHNCDYCFVTESTEGTLTTEGTEVTTEQSVTTTYTDYTSSRTTSTYIPTSTTTTTPGHTTTTSAKPTTGLSCYSCMDCSSIDDDTNTITDDDFRTCVTAIF
ncbi:unnamed protein product, partial [Meganyctiphanes norvegica]